MKITKAYLPIFLVLVCLFLVVNGCQDKTSLEKVSVQANSTRQGTDSTTGKGYNHEMVGTFFYNHITYKYSVKDMWEFATQEDRQQYKNLYDEEYKKQINKDYPQIIDELVQNKHIKQLHGDLLKSFHKDLRLKMEAYTPFDNLWQWCLQREQEVINTSDLNFQEKNTILSEMAVIRYFLKSRIENNDDYLQMSKGLKEAKGARIQLPCWLQDAFCYIENIGIIVGIAAAITTTPLSAGLFAALTAGGVTVGILRCNCDGSVDVCKAPQYLYPQGLCYDPSQGLTLYSADYGNTNPQIQYDLDLNSNGSIDFSDQSYGGQITISNANINGASNFKFRAVSNCDGNLLYSNWTSSFTISQLGQPSIYITGNSMPTRSTQVWYTVNGSNIFSLSWYIPPYYGSIVQTAGNSALIQFTSNVGYAYLSATASSSCGSDTKTFNLQLQ